jgi:ATP-binding cassette subfamily D (ALD) long-chain fatty acid import protein
LEGEYRAGLSRIGRDGEEVAYVELNIAGRLLTLRRFYNGGTREKSILSAAYQRLVKHIHSVLKVGLGCLHVLTLQVRVPYGMTEDFVIKYFWSACGYALMSIPILLPEARHALNPVHRGEVRNEVATRTESGF